MKPVVLSTTIADSGTIFSPLIPWNVHGALVAAALGVSTVAYFPYAFLCSISFVVTSLIGALYFRRLSVPEGDAKTVYGPEPAELPHPELSV